MKITEGLLLTKPVRAHTILIKIIIIVWLMHKINGTDDQNITYTKNIISTVVKLH